MFESFLVLLRDYIAKYGQPLCVVYAPIEKIFFAKPLPAPYEYIKLKEAPYLIQGAWIIPKQRKLRKQLRRLMKGGGHV